MLSTMLQMNSGTENFYQKEIAEVQDEIDLEIEEQQVTEDMLETTPFTEVTETLNSDNKIHLEKVETPRADKQNELEQSFIEDDAVDDIDVDEEAFSSKSEKRARDNTEITPEQDQKRIKVDEDENEDIDLESVEESTKVSTNTQETQLAAEEEIEIAEDVSSQVSSTLQSTASVAERKIRTNSNDNWQNLQQWSTLIPELIHKLITLGNLSLSDIYHLMLTCRSLNQFFNSQNDPWRSLALHSFTFKPSDNDLQLISAMSQKIQDWKKYCKSRHGYTLSIRTSIHNMLKEEHLRIINNNNNDIELLDLISNRIQCLRNVLILSNIFTSKIKNSLSSSYATATNTPTPIALYSDLFFLINNTYFSADLNNNCQVINLVGPKGESISVIRKGDKDNEINIREIEGLNFTKEQYLEYINQYCLDTSSLNEVKSLVDIFTTSTIATTTSATSEDSSANNNINSAGEVDIIVDDEEDVVDIL